MTVATFLQHLSHLLVDIFACGAFLAFSFRHIGSYFVLYRCHSLCMSSCRFSGYMATTVPGFHAKTLCIHAKKYSPHCLTTPVLSRPLLLSSSTIFVEYLSVLHLLPNVIGRCSSGFPATPLCSLQQKHVFMHYSDFGQCPLSACQLDFLTPSHSDPDVHPLFVLLHPRLERHPQSTKYCHPDLDPHRWR